MQKQMNMLESEFSDYYGEEEEDPTQVNGAQQSEQGGSVIQRKMKGQQMQFDYLSNSDLSKSYRPQPMSSY